MSPAEGVRPTAPRTAARPSAADAARRLLLAASVAVAALALLGHGGIDVGTRLSLATTTATTGPGGPGAGARPTTGVVRGAAAAVRASSARHAESQAPAPSSVLRTVLAAALAAGSPVEGAPSGAAPRIAPHLVSRPVARPPSVTYALDLPRGSAGRAPPGAAGT